MTLYPFLQYLTYFDTDNPGSFAAINNPVEAYNPLFLQTGMRILFLADMTDFIVHQRQLQMKLDLTGRHKLQISGEPELGLITRNMI